MSDLKKIPFQEVISFIKDGRFSVQETEEYLKKVFNTYTREWCEEQKELCANSCHNTKVALKVKNVINVMDYEQDILLQELRDEVRKNRKESFNISEDNE